MHTCVRARIHAYIYIHIYTQTHIHTHTHRQTYTGTYTYACLYTCRACYSLLSLLWGVRVGRLCVLTLDLPRQIGKGRGRKGRRFCMHARIRTAAYPRKVRGKNINLGKYSRPSSRIRTRIKFNDFGIETNLRFKRSAR